VSNFVSWIGAHLSALARVLMAFLLLILVAVPLVHIAEIQLSRDSREFFPLVFAKGQEVPTQSGESGSQGAAIQGDRKQATARVELSSSVLPFWVYTAETAGLLIALGITVWAIAGLLRYD
jgi:hypothetical protein